ncbi:a08f6527-b852-43f6-aec9-f94f86d60e1a [Thermothielavioides terrestris]|uniref:A08f6527-b852-43f6-aec9-f94f86d60e1a n=1 Tax=Thermothielavioides terrestris TaxID=2587410 RepID=A0A446BBY2_9PEZI|nr:a08f6527-b852-43f6-aec9-f94f86d60e1a [Thermothielavioides terrestris]
MAPSVSSSSSTTSTSTSPSTSASASTSTSTGVSTTAVTAAAAARKKRSLVPSRWKEAVRVVSMAECREAALTLAHAFAADDYARYLVDDCSGVGGGGGDVHGKVTNAVSAEEEDRWRLHVDILTYTVAAHCMSGLATAVGPECDSVALWVPPGKQIDGWWTRLRSGMWRLYFQLSPEGKKRYFQEILPLLHDTKAAVLGDRDHDAWYLVYLGTKPSSQGRGYAARLLQDMMARADAENRPIYLESSSQANNAYYEKFGFEVKRDIFLERGPVPVRLSIMVREPRVPGCKVAYASPNHPSSMARKFAAAAATASGNGGGGSGAGSGKGWM